MPRLSQFFGITIAIYYNDHAPAHFHALYGEDEATLIIQSLEILSGRLPRRALAMVLEWSVLHRSELAARWEQARAGVRLEPIPPLD